MIGEPLALREQGDDRVVDVVESRAQRREFVVDLDGVHATASCSSTRSEPLTTP